MRFYKAGVSKPMLISLTIVLLIAAIATSLWGLYGNFPAVGNPLNDSTHGLKEARFDFDSGTADVALGQNTPFSLSRNGLSARFSSPGDPAAFSVQSASTTSFKLSKLSGKYLYDNVMANNPLVIEFNRSVTGISFSFATIEYHGGPGREPTPMTLSLYMVNQTPSLVATITVRGSWLSGDSFPQGTVAFNSSGEPFNLARIALNMEDISSATDFLVDDIVVVFE